LYSTLTYDEFVDTYKPIKNNLTKYPSDTQLAFETYGEELDFVLAQPENLVWTEMDGDGGVYIVSGYHLVNRIQYYVCENPNSLPTYQEVVVQLYKECEDCGGYGGYGETEDGKECVTCSGINADDYSIYPDTRAELVEIYGEEYANEQI
jgi:hypothetical protein